MGSPNPNFKRFKGVRNPKVNSVKEVKQTSKAKQRHPEPDGIDGIPQRHWPEPMLASAQSCKVRPQSLQRAQACKS